MIRMSTKTENMIPRIIAGHLSSLRDVDFAGFTGTVGFTGMITGNEPKMKSINHQRIQISV